MLSACDRFNYGDLLFPILVGNYFASCAPRPELLVHALVDSDLGRWGGLPTRSLRKLLRKGVLPQDGVVMFAGGGTLGASWTNMHANLLGHGGNLALYYISRLLGARTGNRISRFCLGGRSAFPWAAKPADFPVPARVVYNAVGGSELVGLPADAFREILDILSEATHLSVRDAETKRILAPIDADGFVRLAPDSAILMSEQFPRAVLESRAGDGIKRLTTGGGRYLCFQSNKGFARLHFDQIVDQLQRIYRQHGLRCVLLPIGRYVGLEDQVCETEIARALDTPAAMAGDDLSLWEIMYTIANADVFVGTSLHGNVTAQSFGVPHLGLSESPCKVDYYLKTWDLPEQADCAPIPALVDRVGTVLGISKSRLDEKSRDLIRLSHENFRDMAAAIGIAAPA